jgi:hypothetical protein
VGVAVSGVPVGGLCVLGVMGGVLVLGVVGV